MEKEGEACHVWRASVRDLTVESVYFWMAFEGSRLIARALENCFSGGKSGIDVYVEVGDSYAMWIIDWWLEEDGVYQSQSIRMSPQTLT